MRLPVLSLSATCVAAASLSFPAFAVTTTPYTSSSQYEAALGAAPQITETYASFANGFILNDGFSADGITYAAFGDSTFTGIATSDFNSFSGISLGGYQTGGAQFFFDGDSLDITFAPTYAIGVFFNVNANSGNFGVDTGSGDALTGSAAYDTNTFVFAGVISDTPFTSATIFGTSYGQGTASFNIPEITLEGSVTATPEPASLALLGTGFLSVAALLRRRTTPGDQPTT